jgi:hypothetical protein
MKIVLSILMVVFSISTFPGEKGNGLNDIIGLFEIENLEKIFNASAEIKSTTLKRLAKKTPLIKEGKVYISEVDTILPLSLELKRYAALIRIFIYMNEPDMLESITIGDKNFYEAMGVNELSMKINALSSISSTEKMRLIQDTEFKYQEFWAIVKGAIEKTMPTEKWVEFKKTIDQEKLGYTLP